MVRILTGMHKGGILLDQQRLRFASKQLEDGRNCIYSMVLAHHLYSRHSSEGSPSNFQ